MSVTACAHKKVPLALTFCTWSQAASPSSTTGTRSGPGRKPVLLTRMSMWPKRSMACCIILDPIGNRTTCAILQARPTQEAPMISHAKISRHRRMFKTLTGLSTEGFKQILPSFEEAWEADLDRRDAGRLRLRGRGGGRKGGIHESLRLRCCRGTAGLSPLDY